LICATNNIYKVCKITVTAIPIAQTELDNCLPSRSSIADRAAATRNPQEKSIVCALPQLHVTPI